MNRATMGRLWLCAVLTVISAFCLVTVISGIGVTQARAEPQESHEELTQVETGFLLRGSGGYVAIFGPGDTEPMTVTDIELRTLRQSDRELLEHGLAVSDREKLLMLLEDLGS